MINDKLLMVNYGLEKDINHLPFTTNHYKDIPEFCYSAKFEEIETATVEGLRHLYHNTNEIIRDLPGLIASKTGFTDAAAGSLAIAFDRGLNQPVVIVVLGSSEAGRFGDVKQLVEATFQTFTPST